MKIGNVLRPRLSIGIRGLSLMSAAVLSFAAGSQAQRRCDLAVNTTPGVGADTACLDLIALNGGGTPIQTASNATRISNQGMTLCKNAFGTQTTGGVADIVYVYDNSGSMGLGGGAWINPANGDTVFYQSTTGCPAGSGAGGANTNGTITIPVWNAAGLATTPTTMPRLISNTGCTSWSGDPYNARGRAFRLGITSQSTLSPLSTAGIMSFNNAVNNSQRPLVLNAANTATVLNSIAAVSGGGTLYQPPLDSSKNWLLNTAITGANRTKAVIFLSDGRPTDTTGTGNYLNILQNNYRSPPLPAGLMPPIYGIFLGKDTVGSGRLKKLSDTTGGQFHLIPPNRPDSLSSVVASIVGNIIVASAPRTVTITNTTVNQTSVSDTLAFDTAGNLSLTLDSIIALRQGTNNFRVTVTNTDGSVKVYTFSIKADGPAATTSTGDLTCYDPPTLQLRDNGGIVTAYTANAASYTVRLVRNAGDSLASVTVSAITKDSMPPIGPGDNESLTLALNNTSGNTATFQANTPFNGQSQSPANNGTLEADANGTVILSWTHPRDSREFAVDTVQGYKIPVLNGVVEITRKLPVSGGSPPLGPITSPVVVLTGPGCLYNCNGPAELAARDSLIPAFQLTTRSPFNFSVYIYDHLGQYVNKAVGGVDSAQWEAARLATGTDSVVSELKILPVSHDGRAFGTGVYILKATIQTLTLNRINAGVETRVFSAKRRFINRFGYVHP